MTQNTISGLSNVLFDDFLFFKPKVLLHSAGFPGKTRDRKTNPESDVDNQQQEQEKVQHPTGVKKRQQARRTPPQFSALQQPSSTQPASSAASSRDCIVTAAYGLVSSPLGSSGAYHTHWRTSAASTTHALNNKVYEFLHATGARRHPKNRYEAEQRSLGKITVVTSV